MAEDINPYAVSNLDGKSGGVQMPQANRPRLSTAAILTAVLILIGFPFAAGFAKWEIETIVASGAALFVAGLVLMVLSVCCRFSALLILAIMTLSVVLGTFLMIFINQWSPAQAAKPIGDAGATIALVMQAGWFAVRQTNVLLKSRQDFDRDRSAGESAVNAGA